jgi:hypothetical protein
MAGLIVTESGMSRQPLADAEQAPGGELFREKKRNNSILDNGGSRVLMKKPSFWFRRRDRARGAERNSYVVINVQMP